MRMGRLPRLVATGAMTLFGVAGVAYGLHSSGDSKPPVAAHTTAAPVFDGQRATLINLESPTAYKPVAAPGTWDDYHCTLLNPHVTRNSFIVASQFYPGSIEVHHSILFLVPPEFAHAAEVANHNGKGWSCFGEAPIPGTSQFQFASTPWLSAWGPGAPENIEPAGTGMPLPAGSLVIMQVHYNLLLGDNPVRSRMQLITVPASTPLKPISLALYPAPPDIPCPSGVHGPLCNRAASLAYTGRQFGQTELNFINLLETVCGRNPLDPPGGDSTSCTWPVGRSGYIVRIAAHMHLLGIAMTVTLNPGTPEAKVLLNVPHYDFNYQRSYNMAAPVRVVPSDRIKVSCTYDPRLRQEIPYLRDLQPQYITWGDGSADEMCLAIVSVIPPG